MTGVGVGRGTVLVTSRSFSGGDVDLEARLREVGLAVVRGSPGHALDELGPLLADAVAWVAGTGPVSAAHLALAPRLRVLARYGVGVDALDLDAAAAAGVVVTNTPGANSEAVSEHTVALLLAGLRGIAAGDARLRAGDWSAHRGRQLAGSRAGVVGFGRIGRATARRLTALGCSVLVHDPFVPDADVRAAGHEPAPLERLRAEADVVTLHLPGGRLLVDATWTRSCRRGQVVVNTARADLVDEAAVADALREGRLAHFAADTLADEQDRAGASPLLVDDLRALVTLTPHLGAQTTEAVDLMGTMAVDDVLDVLDGRPPAHPVGRPTAAGAPVTGTTGTTGATGATGATGSRRRMRFVGVSTGSSSIMTVFPVWSRMLGLDAELVGLDVPLDSPPQTYRDVVRTLAEDPACVGALVTTHKIALYDAAGDLFDSLDTFAREVGEVSSVAVRDGRLRGAAKDPVTAGLALEAVLADDHFSRGGHVLCLGGGGAGTAIGWYLARRPDAPAAMTVVDTSPARLAHLREVVQPHADRTDLRTLGAAGADVAQLLAALPPHSLVVNATGMGKDRPGSPVPDGARWPQDAVVWELNYRGSLEFLAQARAQQEARGLTVVDGWEYFVHGWTRVIADVFDLDLDEATVRELSAAARDLR